MRDVRRTDTALYVRIRSLARGSDLRWVGRYSSLGEYSAAWLALGAAAALAAREAPARRAWLHATLAVGAAHLSSSAIKTLFRRKRPALAHLPPLIATPTGLSFPSCHAAGSFAAVRAYGRLAPRAPLYAAAGGMAFSRVLLGVHYPSDVVAGALLGTAVGTLGRCVAPCR